jgi:hypothetical protein
MSFTVAVVLYSDSCVCGCCRAHEIRRIIKTIATVATPALRIESSKNQPCLAAHYT